MRRCGAGREIRDDQSGQRRDEVAGMAWSELQGLRRDEDGTLAAVEGAHPTWEIPAEQSLAGKHTFYVRVTQADGNLLKANLGEG